jgi:hypothetical protein
MRPRCAPSPFQLPFELKPILLLSLAQRALLPIRRRTAYRHLQCSFLCMLVPTPPWSVARSTCVLGVFELASIRAAGGMDDLQSSEEVRNHRRELVYCFWRPPAARQLATTPARLRVWRMWRTSGVAGRAAIAVGVAAADDGPTAANGATPLEQERRRGEIAVDPRQRAGGWSLCRRRSWRRT